MDNYKLLIEHDGTLYRGNARGAPKDFWSDHDQAWESVSHADEDKRVDWGTIITPEEAEQLKAEGRKAVARGVAA